MEESKTPKMNLDHERKIVELQERVNRLENLCYTAKEVLNLEEASAFLGIAKSTLYKMTHQNRLPYFKPAGKLIFFEKQALLDWVKGAKALSEEELKEEAAHRLIEMNQRTQAYGTGGTCFDYQKKRPFAGKCGQPHGGVCSRPLSCGIPEQRAD